MPIHCLSVSQWPKLGQHWSLETLWSQTPINPLRCTSLPGCPKTVHDHNSCLTILYPSSIIKMVPGDTKDLECTSNVCAMLLLWSKREKKNKKNNQDVKHDTALSIRYLKYIRFLATIALMSFLNNR